VGDVIVNFRGKSVPGIDELHRLLVANVIGVSSTITVVRHTEKLEMVVTPEELVINHQRN
jgi:S1-C subfamily serine protease